MSDPHIPVLSFLRPCIRSLRASPVQTSPNALIPALHFSVMNLGENPENFRKLACFFAKLSCRIRKTGDTVPGAPSEDRMPGTVSPQGPDHTPKTGLLFISCVLVPVRDTIGPLNAAICCLCFSDVK